MPPSDTEQAPPNPLDAPCLRASCCASRPPDAAATIRLALYEARQARRAYERNDETLAACWLDSAIETLADYHEPVEDREGLYEALFRP